MERLAPHQRLPRSSCREREEWILDFCTGRNVLHFACAAWPATQRWCEDGSLLHLRMAEVASNLAGFDLSAEGLSMLRRRGIDRLVEVDLLDPDAVAKAWNQLDFEPEVVIVGELLEHLDAPGVLLGNASRNMGEGSCMVVTVPSAFAVRGLFHSLRGYEKVAPDHVAYYSPATICELLRRRGFVVDEVFWYQRSGPRRRIERALDRLLHPVLKIWPQLSEGVVVRCRPEGAEAAGV